MTTPSVSVKAVVRRAAFAAALALVVAAGVLWAVGDGLTRPASHPIAPPPADLAVQTVRIETSPRQFVVGWFSRGQASGAVLLLHGVHADRTQMIGRAMFLIEAGYAVLLIDLPAHGESSGDRITLGARESRAVIAAINYLRKELPGESIGIIGVSLGAASTVLADIVPAPEAVVLESMYPTIEDAVMNRLRMRFGSIGSRVAPLLLWQLPMRVGVSAEDLQPIKRIHGLGAPVLIASGTDDRHTSWLETERLFEAAAHPKELWRVDGAAHVDLHAFRPDEYRRRILSFFSVHLRRDH